MINPIVFNYQNKQNSFSGKKPGKVSFNRLTSDTVSFNGTKETKGPANSAVFSKIPLLSNVAIRSQVKKEEQLARKLGVKAQYGIHLEQAKEINRALIMAKEAGFELPKKVICEEEYFQKYKNPTSAGETDYLEKIVRIRPIIPKEAMALVKTNLTPIIFTTLHELGHYNVCKAFEKNKDLESFHFNPRLYETDYEKQVTREIGEHAVRRVHEFQADVFAKVVGKEKVSRELLKLFNTTTFGYLKL